MEINLLRQNKIKDFIIKFLIFIFPLSLVSGPLIPDLIISFSSILFLIFLKKEIYFLFKENTFIKIFFLFFLYLVFNSFFSEVMWISMKSSITYIRFLVFVCIIYYLCEYYSNSRYIFLLGLLFTFIILCLDANFQYLTGKNFFGFEPQQYPLRISGMFKDELILGSYLTRLFPLLIGLFFLFFNKKKFFMFYTLIFTLIVSFTIFIAAEKTSIALHFISLILLIYFFDLSKKYKFILFLVLIFFTFVTIFFNSHIKQRVIKQALINSQCLTLDDRCIKGDKYLFSKVHTAHYLTSINIFIEKPIIGSGIKTFRYLCNKKKYQVNRIYKDFGFWETGCSTHPHNTYIQALSEIGIIGFLFLISLFIYISLRLFRHKIEDKQEEYFYRSVLICLFINFFPFAPSGNFFNNYISMMYALPLGFMVSNMKMK